MNESNKEMTHEEAEKDFKNNIYNIFSEKYSGVTKDENGFIVIPRTSLKKKKDSNQE